MRVGAFDAYVPMSLPLVALVELVAVQVPAVFVLDGHCDHRVNGRYELQAYTAGKPVYEHTGGRRYFYYNPDCADHPSYSRDFTAPAWTVSRLYEDWRRSPFDSYWLDNRNDLACSSRALPG